MADSPKASTSKKSKLIEELLANSVHPPESDFYKRAKYALSRVSNGDLEILKLIIDARELNAMKQERDNDEVSG